MSVSIYDLFQTFMAVKLAEENKLSGNVSQNNADEDPTCEIETEAFGRKLSRCRCLSDLCNGAHAQKKVDFYPTFSLLFPILFIK